MSDEPQDLVTEFPAGADPTPATPVLTAVPSSQSATQLPEEAAPQPTFTLEEAARVVVDLVRAHRTIGDGDLAEAIAVLDAEYPAPEDEATEATEATSTSASPPAKA